MIDDNPETIPCTLTENKGLERTTINSIENLPNWFNKESYNASARMNAEYWLIELTIRALYYSMADMYNNIDIFHNAPSQRDYRTRVQYFGNTMLYDGDKEKLLSLLEKQKDNKTKIINNEVVFYAPISKLGTYETSIVKNLLKYCSNSYSLGWMGKFKEGPDLNLCTPDSCLIKIYENSEFYNDDINEFKEWLLNERKNKLIALEGTRTPLAKQIITEGYKIQKINQSQLSGFYECGLLPFLDLHQWALLHNYKITQDTYAEAVLPTNQDAGSSRFGENTITKGENIIAILEILTNQINIDKKYLLNVSSN